MTMPSFSEARKIYGSNLTIGQQFTQESDFVMDELWFNDPQSKICYIYDFFHDDQPSLKDHMTYSHTTKTRIDAKFIVKSYQSIDKDQVEYYLQFRPSQKMEFDQNDELYYFETEYRQRYGVEFPIGLYVDLPDDRGVYRKWLICGSEPANQFPKYLILPCDYKLQWIERTKQERIKREMWVVSRNQNSYIKCVRFILETVCRKFLNCWKIPKANYATAQG